MSRMTMAQQDAGKRVPELTFAARLASGSASPPPERALGPRFSVASRLMAVDVCTMSDIAIAHCDWMRSDDHDDPAPPPYSPASIELRAQVLAHADRHLPCGLDDVHPREIQAYLHSQAWGWKPWTRHTYHCQLHGFYRWAVASGRMSHDPMARLRTPPDGAARPKPVTTEQLRRALAMADDFWRLVLILAAFAGLRASEIAQLERGDITEEAVHVRCGKGGKERFVTTAATVWEAVRDRPPGPLLRRPHGGVVSGRWLSRVQSRFWRSAGLPDVHLHRLRHWFATQMLAAGHDCLVIRDLMGHASVATTQGYVAVAASLHQRAVAALDQLFRSGLI
jgi:integrase